MPETKRDSWTSSKRGSNKKKQPQLLREEAEILYHLTKHNKTVYNTFTTKMPVNGVFM